MADSTLDMTGEEAAVTTLGHGTNALGPSDSSDSGSDVVGGPGMDEGLTDEQTREMPMKTRGTSGRDLGDPALDSDSDRSGTGERGSSGVDGKSPNDTATTIHPGVESASDEFDDPDAVEVERVDSDVRNIAANDERLDDVPAADGAT
jgi:hypothetical protein